MSQWLQQGCRRKLFGTLVIQRAIAVAEWMLGRFAQEVFVLLKIMFYDGRKIIEVSHCGKGFARDRE